MRKAGHVIRTIGDGGRARGVDVSGIDVAVDLLDDDDEITEVRDPAWRGCGTSAPVGVAALRGPAPPIHGAGIYSLRPISLTDDVPRQRGRAARGW